MSIASDLWDNLLRNSTHICPTKVNDFGERHCVVVHEQDTFILA